MHVYRYIYSDNFDVDGSTYPLSPRLVDLVNIIEFFEVDLQERQRAGEYRRKLALDMGTLSHFKGTLQPSEEALVVETLAEINERTFRWGFPLSFRVQGEVLEYVANSRGIYSGDDEENLKAALDLQVMQRVLTKITGTESVRPLLEELQKYFKGWLPLSDEKVRSILIEL